MRDEDGSKKRRDQNATVPGRRTREQIGVEKNADAEAAGRVRRIRGPLEKLKAGMLAEMLVDDALSGDMTSMLLMLRLSGCLGNGDVKKRPRQSRRWRRGIDR